MSNNTVLPGVGEQIEDIDIGGGVKRQVITLGDRAGSTTDVVGPTNEAAPLTDTAASGLNGRLQRIAQNLTTQRSSAQPVSVGDGQDVTFGSRTDARSIATDGTSASAVSIWKQISFSIQAVAATLTSVVTVLPKMGSGGNISVVTAVTGTNYALFGAQNCAQLTIVNDTGVDIEVQQGGSGIALPVFNGTSYTFYGLIGANQLGVRRKDTSNSQVTVKARWEA